MKFLFVVTLSGAGTILGQGGQDQKRQSQNQTKPFIILAVLRRSV